MNERIRELLKQATQYADSLGPIDGAEWCDAEYSKFAELIVKECAHITEVNQAENMGWNISEILKEHFGVER